MASAAVAASPPPSSCESTASTASFHSEDAVKMPLGPYFREYMRDVTAAKVDAKLKKQLFHALHDPCPTPIRKVEIDLESRDYLNIDRELQCDGVGAAAKEGTTHTMEDEHFAMKLRFDGVEARLVGVLDGHGDKRQAANHVKLEFTKRLEEALAAAEHLDDIILTELFCKIIVELELEVTDPAHGITKGNFGTTALFALIFDDVVYLANVGDCRAILVREHEGFAVTEDAWPGSKRFNHHTTTELRSDGPRIPVRITLHNGAERRVLVSVARDLGLKDLRCRPKITKLVRNARDEDGEEQATRGFKEGDLLVLTSDGVTRAFSSDSLVKAAHQMRERKFSPEVMADRLVAAAATYPGNLDDITALVVQL